MGFFRRIQVNATVGNFLGSKIFSIRFFFFLVNDLSQAPAKNKRMNGGVNDGDLVHPGCLVLWSVRRRRERLEEFFSSHPQKTRV